MTVLGDKELRSLKANHHITNVRVGLIQPASIDITLGNRWLDVHTNKIIVKNHLKLYPYNPIYEYFYASVRRFKIPILHRPSFIIAETEQKLALPNNVAGDVKLKSTPSRAGFDVSMGGWIDPGYVGTLSIVIRTYKEAILRSHESFCQIVFHKLNSPTTPYTGKYQHSRGPVAAKDNYYE